VTGEQEDSGAVNEKDDSKDGGASDLSETSQLHKDESESEGGDPDEDENGTVEHAGQSNDLGSGQEEVESEEN
jgi:hypothetical protein